MKNNSLDELVKCSIDISSPASSDASFDSILLVVEDSTEVGTETATGVTPIRKADDLLDYGYKTTDPAYIAASIAFSQSPAPGNIYFVIRTKDDSTGTFSDLKTLLSDSNGQASWYGFHLTSFKDASDVKAAVEWAEANDKLFGFEYTDIDACPVTNFSYYRSFGDFSGKADGYADDAQPDENKYSALAKMAKCFGYEPGSETWANKTLATIVPSVLSSADDTKLTTSNINRFKRFASKNITLDGKVLAGEWIDTIRFRDWLKAKIQENVFNALIKNPKLPYTDAGIGVLESAVYTALKLGQDNGGIAPNEYDGDNNLIEGFAIKVPRNYEISEAERQSRKLSGLTFSARLAGAIHLVEIKGNLSV